MFLVDPALAASDWDGIIALIEGILKKAGAEIICLRKWAERKLAYEIQHKTRGTYIQCYFRTEGSKITDIERDLRLSERVMRTLILLADDRPAGVVEKDMATLPKEVQESPEVVQKAVAAVEQTAELPGEPEQVVGKEDHDIPEDQQDYTQEV